MLFVDYQQLEFIDPLVRHIVHEIEERYGFKVITSLFRIGDLGVHGTLPLRAMDLREKDQLVGRVIRGWVNSRWIYDPERPSLKVCKYHNTGHGWHLHIQVHRNTIRR